MIAKTIYRVSLTCCTILIRYMALASLPEIARPSSEMVVGYMYIEIHFGVGENWPCECISVRSLHQIVTNHPNAPLIRYISFCLGIMRVLGEKQNLKKKKEMR